MNAELLSKIINSIPSSYELVSYSNDGDKVVITIKLRPKEKPEEKKPEEKPEVKPEEKPEVKPEEKAEPKKPESKKAEPKKAEPKKAESKKPEPKKPESKKAEPKKAESKKVEEKKVEEKEEWIEVKSKKEKNKKSDEEINYFAYYKNLITSFMVDFDEMKDYLRNQIEDFIDYTKYAQEYNTFDSELSISMFEDFLETIVDFYEDYPSSQSFYKAFIIQFISRIKEIYNHSAIWTINNEKVDIGFLINKCYPEKDKKLVQPYINACQGILDKYFSIDTPWWTTESKQKLQEMINKKKPQIVH